VDYIVLLSSHVLETHFYFFMTKYHMHLSWSMHLYYQHYTLYLYIGVYSKDVLIHTIECAKYTWFLILKMEMQVFIIRSWGEILTSDVLQFYQYQQN
jgi:hypothetical protein